ncbi:hypothetical protein ABB37_03164 [Leptomonas pyrrhocoris]|uniref:Uncharacterized protein n=1 Tax=Leptomonas pyrrhocoris TaxID=157538 RepID=A0A0M9G409_LEPPY|nr:hypothetical protein ABB37_03164 [Leptomonas pyrrhocoris]KPA81980.1 hypothetical protein ABB37_03164 [Leptomonas pyrrhocoris]|eukprot:XP_015660419.1 hypothetical protein ABB37_03164 [Leptomonas pyrrhocoris]
MHVEIRLSEAEQVCAFDTQSFYRVKQLLANHGGSTGGEDNSSKCTASAEPMLRIPHKLSYTPQFKLQLVVERLIELESQVISARMCKKQHEARTKSNWNNSDVGTAYHSATIDEVILAALPLAAADSVIKIRLLQLPPPLDYDAQQTVKKALGNVTTNEYRHDTPLCIGVAKITLRDMMAARRTVSIAMQAKRTIFSTVEAHNLDTLVTNAMFGKGESSGSALLSLQINGYTFGRVPKGRLLLYNGAGEELGRNSTKGSETHSTGKQSVSTAGGEDAKAETEAESLNSPAIRFVLIPYVALVDVVLRVSDVASWRVPRKTAMALAMVVVALYADLFDVACVLMATLHVLLFIRNISLFYCVPISDSASRTNASPAMPSGADNFQPYLYSRDNALLNSLLRARVFFSRGLLEDTYFELALSAHLARHSRRQIAVFVLVVCAGFLTLSIGSVVVLLTLGIFTAYPIYLNAPPARRRRRKKLLSIATVYGIVRVLRTPARLRVVRVVRVAVVRSKSAVPQPEEDTSAASTSMALQQQFLGYIRQHSESIGAGSITERSDASPRAREGSTLGMHRRARTMDIDGLVSNAGTFSSTIDHFQMTHALRFFVALCLSPAGPETAGPSSSTGIGRKTSSCLSFQRRMMDQLRQARTVNTLVAASCPQAGSIAVPGSCLFPAQSSVLMTESKPSAVSKEVQDAFHAYFNSTIGFLSFLRQQSTVHPYVTQSVLIKCAPDSMRSVSVLAPTQCLVDLGDDDSVTKAIVGRRVAASALPPVGKFNTSNPIEVTGRVMALYAAYLLQGARLSVYTSASRCTTIIPLMAPGNRIERFTQPNPCPLDLLNTLDSVWRGETNDTAGEGQEVFFTADAVIQIVTVYKNFWTGDAAMAPVRTSSKLELGGNSDTAAAHVPQRHPIRNVFAALGTMPRHASTQRSTTAYAGRSPRGLLSPGRGGGAGGSGANVIGPTFPRSDFGSTRAGPNSPGPSPLRLPPSQTVDRWNTNVVSETTGSVDVNHASVAMSEPPLLEATNNGESRVHSFLLDDKDSPDPKQTLSRQVSSRLDIHEKTLKPSKKA